MATDYVLVDFENLQPDMSGLAGTPHQVVVFFGAKQQTSRHHFEKFDALFDLGANLRRVKVPQSGKNALDMHIACEIGRILEREKDAVIHVISADTDFDPLIATLSQHHRISRAKDVTALVRRRAPSAAPAAGAGRKAKASAAKKAPPAVDIEPIVKQLRSMNGKPATRKALAQTIAAWFKHHGGAKTDRVVDQVIDEMIRRGLVAAQGNRVNYTLD